MAVRSGLALVGILTGAALASCDRGPVGNAAPVAPEIAERLPEAPADLYALAACGDARPQAPVAGRTFHYRFAPATAGPPPVERRQTIVRVTGDQTTFEEATILFGSTMPGETRQARFGFLPTAAPGRQIRYEEAASAIAALTPGASAPLNMVESVDGGGSASGVATVTFVGCGTSGPLVAGLPGAPVRIYHLALPYADPAVPGALSKAVELEFVVSDAEGWPIAERTPSGTFTLDRAPTS